MPLNFILQVEIFDGWALTLWDPFHLPEVTSIYWFIVSYVTSCGIRAQGLLGHQAFEL